MHETGGQTSVTEAFQRSVQFQQETLQADSIRERIARHWEENFAKISAMKKPRNESDVSSRLIWVIEILFTDKATGTSRDHSRARYKRRYARCVSSTSLLGRRNRKSRRRRNVKSVEITSLRNKKREPV